ncbi:hypothetical protein BKA67DRAFT_636118 [Truncatella angustata]|uniref:Uncharacterized protein n=1 Tax=Truncatella angustata TaxID=152316 RepID=A0A9P8UNY6_9PEZI|nr:uncharacterized protein BKA67DRAFT_636118 [Truncatella angustata]KAH6655572.1 hypothetical protein BKA67DRAFT_636118 [Truncatella angustata]
MLREQAKGLPVFRPSRRDANPVNPHLNRKTPRRGISQDTLVEDESYDMSLLKSAAPFGTAKTYATIPVEESTEPSTPIFDMTSFSGPMGPQDHVFLKNLQEQEANGQLTGGLGSGINPDTRITGGELLATSPTVKRSFSFSRALSVRRKPTVRNEIRGLGQTAANKTGEVIEVIIEEPSEDLSNMTGPTAVGVDPHSMRRSTFPRSDTKKEVFYPQPNWKPFAMRWPYLMSLILLSLGLAIAQELLYRQSVISPLMKFEKPDEIKPIDYFVLKFLPTIVTVTFGVLWSITDSEVKRLEAFYQVSKEGGALAAESVNVDYLTLFNLMGPIRAFQRKHYTVAVSSIMSLLAVSLVPTLGSAAIIMNPDKKTRQENVLIEKTITINPTLSRLLTSTFVIIAVLGMILFYQLQSRRSGLLADVKGIAGLASMAVVSHIMMDFKDMDVAKPKDIHYKLRNYRYVLRNSSLARDDSSPMTTQERDRYKETHLPENPHPLILRAKGGIPFIVGILLFLGFVPLFLFTPVSELTDKAPWIVTALAVCIKLAWGSLDTDIRMMEPYYILSKRHAPAKTLTLDYTAMPFAWVAIRALLNKHWLVALVGFGTVLSETLTIYVTSLATVEGKDFIDQIRRAAQYTDNTLSGGPLPDDPNQDFNSGQETVGSFVLSLAFTAFTLLYMFTVATLVFVRRRHPFLPRQPNTIASILAFMHQSKMLYDFVGTAKYSNAEMLRKLQSLGKTYGLGWFEGRDGQTHCGVDEEELTGSYKHGIDYSQGNKPWDREWQLF